MYCMVLLLLFSGLSIGIITIVHMFEDLVVDGEGHRAQQSATAQRGVSRPAPTGTGPTAESSTK